MTGNDRPARLHDRSRRTVRGALAALLAAAASAAGCARTPPEDALRASVATLETAIEAREPGSVAALLADDFVGPDGLDRAGARRLAQLGFMRHRAVDLVVGPLDIALQEDHATVRFTAALAGGPGTGLPDAGSVYRVESGWRREGDAWVLTSARWERDL